MASLDGFTTAVAAAAEKESRNTAYNIIQTAYRARHGMARHEQDTDRYNIRTVICTRANEI